MPPFKGNLEQNVKPIIELYQTRPKIVKMGGGLRGGLRLKGTATNTLLLKGYFQTSYACFRLDRAIDG